VRCNGLVVMEMGNGVSALFYLQSHIFWHFGMFVDIFFRYIYNPLVCISEELHFQDHLSTRHLVCVYTFVVQVSHDLIPCTIILHLVQEIICTTLTDFHRHSTSQVQPFTPFIITPVLSSIMETQPSHPVQHKPHHPEDQTRSRPSTIARFIENRQRRSHSGRRNRSPIARTTRDNLSLQD